MQKSLKLLKLFRSVNKKMLKFSQIIAGYLYYLVSPSPLFFCLFVCLFVCFSKILKRMIFNRCVDYISKGTYFMKSNFLVHSTLMAIIESVDKNDAAVKRK